MQQKVYIEIKGTLGFGAVDVHKISIPLNINFKGSKTINFSQKIIVVDYKIKGGSSDIYDIGITINSITKRITGRIGIGGYVDHFKNFNYTDFNLDSPV